MTLLYFAMFFIDKEKSLVLEGNSDMGSYFIKLDEALFCFETLKNVSGIFSKEISV